MTELLKVVFSICLLYLEQGSLRLIVEDVNRYSRRDVGREGFDDWQVLALAAVRLGCNLDYDKLQDLAEQHRALRHIMGIGDWDDETSFNWRRIRNTLCLLKPETIHQINQVIVAEGHAFDPEAAKKVRADSFVVETDIHYPSESSFILDGITKILSLCAVIAGQFDVPGWRQHEHLLKKVKKTTTAISRLSSRKSPKSKSRMEKQYRRLLKRAKTILERAEELHHQVLDRGSDEVTLCRIIELKRFIELTQQVCSTAHRRVIEGETVPNEDKIFSIFETHTQLYRRGKAKQPNQFGRLVMVYEDAAGFISHYFMLPRDAQDADVVVEQTQVAQERHNHQIEDASFDRGFYSSENEELLQAILEHPCLPKKVASEYQEQTKNAVLRDTVKSQDMVLRRWVVYFLGNRKRCFSWGTSWNTVSPGRTMFNFSRARISTASGSNFNASISTRSFWFSFFKVSLLASNSTNSFLNSRIVRIPSS